MIFEQLEVGQGENLTYILGCEKTKEAVVIDPSDEPDRILNTLNKHKLTLKAIFLTHTHSDHWEALPKLLETFKPDVYVSAAKVTPIKWLARKLKKVSGGEKIQIGDELGFKTLATPGHSPCGMCYEIGGKLFAGDTVFIQGCGRCDLPGSDPNVMYESLQKIKALPDGTIVYPGHCYGRLFSATIGELKKTNPYFTAKNLEEFLERRCRA